jgi:predicted transcriptional regulator
MLIAFITTHEGIRLPLTGIGLSLMGLIGRTHETNDGKFQRGRLMGYLTANPGCHFRALLGALQMSNGQLTHHIKVLEDEERIWRRPDGRLMRFYPSTISMATPEDELPIPPLSPDPNSLQGKILKLLDGDGQMGAYPTQADLAIRLEKSQQLVSHHLRTLQKFGLVEKKKFGVRNRYKLTREALFLLESNDL